jgi:glutaredoxin 3
LYNLFCRIDFSNTWRNALSLTREKTAIKLYTGDHCAYCRRVQRELERLDLDYEAVNADGREEVIQLSGQQAIPILTLGDEVLVNSSHIIRELRRRYVA